MTDLKKVLFLYRQSSSFTQEIEQGEGDRMVVETGVVDRMMGETGVVERMVGETVVMDRMAREEVRDVASERLLNGVQGKSMGGKSCLCEEGEKDHQAQVSAEGSNRN